MTASFVSSIGKRLHDELGRGSTCDCGPRNSMLLLMLIVLLGSYRPASRQMTSPGELLSMAAWISVTAGKRDIA